MNYKKEIIVCLFICIFSFIFKASDLFDRYKFDWDQSDDAVKVMSMVWDKKPTLIGPRVAGPEGFFAAPYHYYFLLPFYLATQGDPIAGAYAAIFVGIISTALTYFVAIRLFGFHVGVVAGLIAATTSDITSWNAMFITPIALLGYYLLTRLFDTSKYLFSTMVFIAFFSVIHLVPSTLILYFFVALFLSGTPKIQKISIKFVCMLFFSLLPLIIFDFRHEFINLHQLGQFLFGNKSQASFSEWLYLRTFWRSLNITTSSLFDNLYIEKVLIIISFIWTIIKTKEKNLRIFNIIWILVPLLFLSQYHGNIPEYYYGMVIALTPIFFANLLVSIFPKFFVGLFVLLVFYSQIVQLKTKTYGVTLADKMKVVRYIINQPEYPIFNVSYDLPYGENTGYPYLFKYNKHEPFDGPEGHLFSIALTSDDTENFVFKSGLIGVIKR